MAPIDATRVSLLGFGTVGQALAEQILARDDLLVVSVTDRSGTLHDARGLDLRKILARKRASGSIGGRDARAPAADVVVDLLPTDLRDARDALARAVRALGDGSHFVTAAKGALALHGPELRRAAARAGREVRASATVCGGTPALELLHAAFRGDRLLRFEGVLNGSTNFLLARIEEGAEWDEALREARKRGILEADPSQDLLGLDAAAKAVILSNAAWGAGLTLADARVDGIVGVRPEEARRAAAQGLAVRLVARASPEKGVAVSAVTLPRDHPLVVPETENALRLTLERAGPVTLRGRGAGGRETAAAVLGDLLALRAAPRSRPVKHGDRVTRAMDRSRPDGVTLAAFAALVLLAGGNAVGIWYSNQELAPFWGAALRFGAAALIFAGIALARRRPFPRGAELAGAIGYGVLGFGAFYALGYWGIQEVPPGTAQVILALVPLATFLLATIERQEPFRWRGLAGALVAAAGIAIVFQQQVVLDVPLAPLAALVVAALSAAQAALIVKRHGSGDPVATNALAMGVGTAVLLALSLAAGEARALPAQPATRAAYAYLVVGGSVAVFWLYLFVLRRWTASGASYQFVLFPFVTLTLSAWLTGERLTLALLAGALLVLVGVYVGALRGAREDAPRAPPPAKSDP